MGKISLDPKCLYSILINYQLNNSQDSIETSGQALPSVFGNNWTKMSRRRRRRRLCFVLHLLSAESCSLCCSTPAATPPATPTIPSFLLSLLPLPGVLVVVSLGPCTRAWWQGQAVGLIISVETETGGDHCSPQLGSGRSHHVWWWRCDRQTRTDTTTSTTPHHWLLLGHTAVDCRVVTLLSTFHPPANTPWKRSMYINSKSCRVGEMLLQIINSWAGLVCSDF